MERSTDLSFEWRRADEARDDAQLLALAAHEAGRLRSTCEGWPLDRFCTLVFSVALVGLKATLGPYAHAALRRRYYDDVAGFRARLDAHGI